MKKKFTLITISIFFSMVFSQTIHAQYFVHPGIPWTTNDLDQMKAHRTMHPWSKGWEIISNSNEAKLGYNMRGPAVNVDRKDKNIIYDSDAVLYHALQWYFTGNETYAEEAIDILMAWGTTHKTWSGNAVHLHAAYRGGTFVKGAEILRHTYPGWTEENTTVCENYFSEIIWPQFRLPDPVRAANQGANNLWGAIQVAIFCNDREKFDMCIDAYLNDACSGISNTLPNGQCGDTGRDQGHAMGMLENMASFCEIAWAQGVDLYRVLNNRLLIAHEYWCKYNLGEDVEFIPYGTCYNYFPTIGAKNRTSNQVYSVMVNEQIYGAYVVRKGLEAPYLTKYRKGIRFDKYTFLHRKDESFKTQALTIVEPEASLRKSEIKSLKGVNIGSVDLKGKNKYRNKTWKLTGAGSDISGDNNEDAYYFAYTKLSGDGSLIAKVTSIESVNNNAKAAVIIRETLQPDSKTASVSVHATNGAEFTSRGFYAADGKGSLFDSDATVPVWIKIERRGNNIVGYVGPDGVSWSPMQNTSFAISEEYYIGLGVSSSDKNKPCTVLFTDVQIGIAD